MLSRRIAGKLLHGEKLRERMVATHWLVAFFSFFNFLL